MAQSLATGVCLLGGSIHQPAATPRAPRCGDTGLHRRAACVCGAVTTRANKACAHGSASATPRRKPLLSLQPRVRLSLTSCCLLAVVGHRGTARDRAA